MFQSLPSPFNSFRRYLEGSTVYTDFAQKAQLHGSKNAVTQSDINEALQLRQALEPLVIELAMPRISRKQLAELDALIERHGQAAGNPRAGAMFRELDKRFHMYLAELSGNRRLVSVTRAIWDLLLRADIGPFNTSENMEAFRREHAQLVEAIRGADCAAAKEILARHIDRAHDAYLSGCEPQTRNY